MKKFLSAMTLVLFSILLTSCKKEEETTPTEETKPTATIDFSFDHLKESGYYEYLNDENPVIVINVKNYGNLVLQLFPSVAKTTVDNFISYVINEDYNESTFHRVIKDFMIQGGKVQNPRDPIIGEFIANGVTNNLKHYRGVLSMARSQVFNSATSQFFIMHKTSPHLDGGYAGFGALINGFDVLDEIALVERDGYDEPLQTITISKIIIYLNDYKIED